MGLFPGGEQVERGWTLAEHIHDLLHKQVEALEDLRDRDEMTVRANAQAAPGGVVVDVPLETNYFDPGSNWTVTRFSAKGPPNGQVEVYLDTAGDPMQLVETFTLNANGSYADAVSNNLFVPGGRQVIARFLGPPAVGTACVLRAQIRRTLTPAQKHPPVEGEYPPPGHHPPHDGADPMETMGDPQGGRVQSPHPGGQPPQGWFAPEDFISYDEEEDRGQVDERS